MEGEHQQGVQPLVVRVGAGQGSQHLDRFLGRTELQEYFGVFEPRGKPKFGEP